MNRIKMLARKAGQFIKRNTGRAVAAITVGGITASNAMAAGEPLDLAAAGASLAGYVAGAAGAGVLVFIAIRGVKIIKKAFSSAS